jgi:hypothetical protein
LYLPCPYSWFERIKSEVAAFGGMVRNADFGMDVEFDILLPDAQVQPFLDRVFDISSGTIEGMITGSEYRAFPIE